MATWSSQYINSLPNSSFAWIDKDGNRNLPYKDKNGNVDGAHTRNALARLNQVQGMSDQERTQVENLLRAALAKSNGQTQNDAAPDRMFKVAPVKLDANGELPSKVLLFITGDWPNSVKGDFAISLDDLKEMKQNFDAGVGFPTEDASTGLAVDFKHEYLDEAAGWIKGLELEANEADGTGKLYANPVEWSDAGAQAVKNGRYKCISPSGYFGRKGGRLSMWANPNNLKEKVSNVLDGAGLTNFPFLRGMSPIRANATDDNEDLAYDDVIFVSNSKPKKEQSMNLDAIRVKAPEDLTADEKTFVEQHKSELAADELKKFGLTAEADNTNTNDGISDDDKALLASIKSGDKMIVDKATAVDPERLSALEATAKKYETEKAEGIVEAHVKRGAIKQDSAKFWTKSLLDATGDGRKQLEDQLAALPTNEQLSKELGSGEDVAAGSTAREQLDAIARKKVEAAAKDGKELLYADALKQASRENADLTTQDTQEQLAKAGV